MGEEELQEICDTNDSDALARTLEISAHTCCICKSGAPLFRRIDKWDVVLIEGTWAHLDCWRNPPDVTDQSVEGADSSSSAPTVASTTVTACAHVRQGNKNAKRTVIDLVNPTNDSEEEG